VHLDAWRGTGQLSVVSGRRQLSQAEGDVTLAAPHVRMRTALPEYEQSEWLNSYLTV